MYAESICGVAQIVRDPSISADTPRTKADSYIGLPTVFGAYTVSDEMKLLKSATGFA